MGFPALISAFRFLVKQFWLEQIRKGIGLLYWSFLMLAILMEFFDLEFDLQITN